MKKSKKQKKQEKWAKFLDDIAGGKNKSLNARKIRQDDRKVEKRKRSQFHQKNES